jgi:putative nucleotidyltransferase with HDIG domain
MRIVTVEFNALIPHACPKNKTHLTFPSNKVKLKAFVAFATWKAAGRWTLGGLLETSNEYRSQYGCTRALTAALFARDQNTQDHCGRVEDSALRLAHAIGLSKQDATIVGICARFHDIGKVGIPDSILLKPARLTESEWQVMKTHSAIGERILRETGLPGSGRIARVIRCHHENFAGDGYPDGLKGEAIPIESRIILIVDAYDAMRSTRPNRPARAHDQVMEIMESEKGWKFDPHLFQLFLTIADSYA